jgi:molecular chaperone Hsp33
MLSLDEARGHTLPDDNLVLPFRTVTSGVGGRVVRLGSVVDAILSRHAYPEPVSHALGESLALVAMLGAAMKEQAKFILQTKSDGPLGFLVADCESPGKVRGYASFDKANAALAAIRGRGDQGVLLGKGHLAMTIDPGGEGDRYQGIVALERQTLAEAADTYFCNSVQLPTFMRLAVARHYGATGSNGERGWRWRAGGLLVQRLGREEREIAAGDDNPDEDEDWNRVRHLAATVEDHELLDPMLSPERLLYRLFHEEGVRVTPATALAAACRCSRERIAMYLEQFGAKELADMREPDGGMTATCEFCSRQYKFAAGEFAGA